MAPLPSLSTLNNLTKVVENPSDKVRELQKLSSSSSFPLNKELSPGSFPASDLESVSTLRNRGLD